jgi:hypothetical protein
VGIKFNNRCEIIKTSSLAQKKHTKMDACVMTKRDIRHVVEIEGHSQKMHGNEDDCLSWM